MVEKDGFLGQWLVSEYIYNLDGKHAGIVRQTRKLFELEPGLIQIVQFCEPEAELNNHPMGRFNGEWIFDIRVEGRNRYYLGPDVIGSGVSWEEGVMTGMGLWPNFGQNFTSYAFLPQPERQVTGGVFLNATEPIAKISGLAIPDDGASDYPDFEGPKLPFEISANWQGKRRRLNAHGDLLGADEVNRTYSEDGAWEEYGLMIRLTDRNGALDLRGSSEGKSIYGLAKRFGWALDVKIVVEPSIQIEMMEVLDAKTKTLVSLQKEYHDHQLTFVDVLQLKAI